MKKIILILCLILTSLVESYEAPQPGSVISSPSTQYTIIQELGEGFFGKVFRVVDSSGKSFAMKWYKEIPQDFLDDNPFLNAIGDAEREYNLGQIFNHPNILKSVELFSDDEMKNHFLVLDFIQGQTLFDTPRKSIALKQGLSASNQLVDALKYSDELGYIYMDMHGGNLMMTADNQLMIIDLAGFFSWKELSDLMQKKARGVTTDQCIGQQYGPKRAAILKRFLEAIPSSVPGWVIDHFSTFYLDRATEAIVYIQSKTDSERDDKIERRVRIKKMAWEYSEDTMDGAETAPLSEYFDKLSEELNN